MWLVVRSWALPMDTPEVLQRLEPVLSGLIFPAERPLVGCKASRLGPKIFSGRISSVSGERLCTLAYDAFRDD